MGGAAAAAVGVVAGLERGGGAAERGHRMTAPRVAEQRVRATPAARPAASGHLDVLGTPSLCPGPRTIGLGGLRRAADADGRGPAGKLAP